MTDGLRLCTVCILHSSVAALGRLTVHHIFVKLHVIGAELKRAIMYQKPRHVIPAAALRSIESAKVARIGHFAMAVYHNRSTYADSNLICLNGDGSTQGEPLGK